MDSERYLILDGGLATELEARGHCLEDHLWSARLLRDAPEVLADVHRAYLEAGADCVTSASYQATIPGLVASGVSHDEACNLIRRSVELVKHVRDDFWADTTNRAERIKPRVAASVGPYGAYLANGAEYSGNYDLDEEGLIEFHEERWGLLWDQSPDYMLCETIPTLTEAKVLATLAQSWSYESGPKVWVSFSCIDDQRISDRTPIVECAKFIESTVAVSAVGVNCTAPRFVLGLVERIRQVTSKPIIVYPNSGERYDVTTKQWSGDAKTEEFLQLAERWYQAGATIIGGCCRTGPALIAGLRRQIR